MIGFQYIKNMKKSKTRLFIEQKLAKNMLIDVQDKQHHFLKNVIRIKINDEIKIFDNKTGEWLAKISLINRHNTVLKIVKKNREMLKENDIWLAFAPIKANRLNITIQKATELGVAKFMPCKTDYTNNHFINYKNLELNIIEAAEQCERLDIPVMEKLISLEKFINSHPKDRAIIFCNEKNKKPSNIFESILNIKKQYAKWTVLIGPEGGFSESEEKIIINNSSTTSISLGTRVLRSDTATAAAIFALQSLIENKT